MGAMTWKPPTTIEGTMNRAKTSFSTEIFAGAIISRVQYIEPLAYNGEMRAVSLKRG
jgi:hypothetical protein